MSAGPAIVPMRRQPRSISASGRHPAAGDVVGVDVGDLVGAGPRPADEGAGQVEGGEVVGQAVVAVVRDHQGAVDVAVAEVAQHPLLLLARARQQQHQLQVALGEHPGDAAQGARRRTGRRRPARRARARPAPPSRYAASPGCGRPGWASSRATAPRRPRRPATSALTRLPPLMARDAVARETPASRATSSSVGEAPGPSRGRVHARHGSDPSASRRRSGTPIRPVRATSA